MDQQYQEFSDLLYKCASFRQSKHYKKSLNAALKAETRELCNVEIELHSPVPKLIDPHKWPVAKDSPKPKVNAKRQPEEYQPILAALELLK